MTRAILAFLCLACSALAQARVDQHGDPLPEGAIARFGTTRFTFGRDCRYALSPDGKTIAIDHHYFVTLMDSKTGCSYQRLKVQDEENPHYRLTPLAFSSDGKTLAFFRGAVMHIWDLPSGKLRRTFKCAAGDWLAFFPGTQKLVITAHNWPGCWVYDSVSGEELSQLDATATLSTLTASGKYFHGPQYDSTKCLIDSRTGRVKCRFKNTDDIYTGCFTVSKNERRYYVVTDEGHLQIYSTRTGKRLEDIAPPPGTEELLPTRIELSPDGDQAYVRWEDGPIGRYDFRARNWLKSLPVVAGKDLCVHPDGTRLFVADRDGLLRRFDLATGEEIRDDHGLLGRPTAVPSPDGRSVAVTSGTTDSRLELFDVKGQRLWSVRREGTAGAPRWSLDGRLLAVAGDKHATVVDARTGKIAMTLLPLDDHTPFSGLLSFTPDNRFLVVAINDGGGVATFNLTSGKCEKRLNTNCQGVTDISPDGRSMSFCNGSPGIALFDLAQERVSIDFPYPPPAIGFCGVGSVYRRGHADRIVPGGLRVLSWSPGGTAHFWNATNGEPDGILQTGYYGTVTCSAFSLDGQWLAACAADGTVGIWEVASGHRVASWQAHTAPIQSVAFAGPGRVVTTSFDLTGLLWDMRPRKMLKLADWDAIVGNNALEAYRAIWAIADDPTGAEFLRARVAPVQPAAAEKVKQQLADLGADRYARREAATKELQSLGRLIEPELRSARTKVTNEEVRMRLNGLIARIPRDRNAVEIIHARAVAAMELSGSEAARKLLGEWAAGAPGARLTIDAKAALGRLSPPK